jgi:integrase
LRPGALADLKVINLHQQLQVLTIGKDKSGQDRRIKLPPQTFEFFKSLCVDKRPEAPVFTRENGTAWKKDNWKKPFKEAAKLAGLAPAVTAYAIRHSVITDLVTGESGAVPLDLLTVAQLSGTSVAMIERHYGHLRSDLASIALASLAV